MDLIHSSLMNYMTSIKLHHPMLLIMSLIMKINITRGVTWFNIGHMIHKYEHGSGA